MLPAFAPNEGPEVAGLENIDPDVFGFADSGGLAPNRPGLGAPPRPPPRPPPNDSFCPVAPFEGGLPAGVVDTEAKLKGFAGVAAVLEALAEPNIGPAGLLVVPGNRLGEEAGALLFSFPPAAGAALLLPKLKPPLPPFPPPKSGGAAEVPAGFPNKPPAGVEEFAAPKSGGVAAPDVFAPPKAVPCEAPVVLAPKGLAAVVLPAPNMLVPPGLEVAGLAEPNNEGEEAGLAEDPKRPLELVCAGFDAFANGLLLPLPVPPAPAP